MSFSKGYCTTEISSVDQREIALATLRLIRTLQQMPAIVLPVQTDASERLCRQQGDNTDFLPLQTFLQRYAFMRQKLLHADLLRRQLTADLLHQQLSLMQVAGLEPGEPLPPERPCFPEQNLSTETNDELAQLIEDFNIFDF